MFWVAALFSCIGSHANMAVNWADKMADCWGERMVERMVAMRADSRAC